MQEPRYGIDIPYDYPETPDNDEPHKEACPHPPTRLYAWYAYDDILCICCNDCGAVLKGSVK